MKQPKCKSCGANLSKPKAVIVEFLRHGDSSGSRSKFSYGHSGSHGFVTDVEAKLGNGNFTQNDTSHCAACGEELG